MKFASLGGLKVEIISINGGWTTINDGAVTRKVRNGALKPWVPTPAPTRNVERKKAADKPPASTVDTRLVKADLSRYVVTDIKTPTGRKSVDSNDQVAALLRGLTLEQVYATAAKTIGSDHNSLLVQYKHLNPGMQRMNLGNRIRKVLKQAQ